MTTHNDDDKLNTLKSEIRCILLSRKDGIGVKEFLSDYKLLVGKQFPVSQFGFRNILDLFNSLPDTIKVIRPCGGPELLMPVVSENTQHINKLVIGQKEQKKFRRPRPFQLPSDERVVSGPRRAPPRPPPGFAQENVVPSRGWENKNSRGLLPSHPANFQVNPPWMGGGAYPTPKWPQAYNGHNPPRRESPVHTQISNGSPQNQNQNPSTSGEMETREQVSIESTSSRKDSFSNTPDSKLVPYRLSEEDEEIDISSQKQEKRNSSGAASLIEGTESIADLSDIEDDVDDMFSKKVLDNFKGILKEHPNGILASKFNQVYKEKFKESVSHYDFGYRSVHEMATSLPHIFSVHMSKTTKGVTDWILFDATMSESASKWIPSQVIDNMQKLSLTYPNGIAASDVTSVYKTKFKVTLDVKKLGFENITTFLVNCPSVMCTVHDEKCIVYPINWGKDASSEEENISIDELGLPLDNVEYLWKDLFSPQYCNPSFKYKKFILPEATTMRVIVADALSPDLIWLQRPEYLEELTDLMSDLNTFYEEHENDCLLTDAMVIPGLACAAKFSGQWHRALICQPKDRDVKVLYIDYGTTGFLKRKELRTLHRKFSDLPIQAVRAKLHGICPVNKNDGWSNEANEYLFSLCLNNTFYAEIITKKPEIPSLEVLLIDTNEEEDKIINRLLVKAGHAYSENNMEKSSEGSKNASLNTSHGFELGKRDISLMPDFFLSLLPKWLNPNNNWEDVYRVIQQAQDNNQRTASDSQPCNSSSSSCCDRHILKSIFINNPKLFCTAWEETYKSLEDAFHREMFKYLSNHLKPSIEWTDNLKTCKIEEENNEKYNGVTENESEKHNGITENESASHSSQSNMNHSEESDNRHIINEEPATCKVNEIVANTSFDSSSKRSSSSQESGLQFNLCGQNGIFISQKYVLDKWFSFILYNEKVYLLRDELLKGLSPTYTPEIFKMKLRGIKTAAFNFITIGPKLNTNLYDELLARCLVREKEKAYALPLEKVASFIIAILPNYANYATRFREMTEEFDPQSAMKFMEAVY